MADESLPLCPRGLFVGPYAFPFIRTSSRNCPRKIFVRMTSSVNRRRLLFTNQVRSRMFVWREKATHRMRFSRLTKSTPARNALAASTRLLRCAPLGIFNRRLLTRPLCEPSAFDFQLKLPTFNSELPTRRPGANSRRMRTYPNRGLNAFIMSTCRKERWGPRRLAQKSTASRDFARRQNPSPVDEPLMSRAITKSRKMNTYEKRVGG